MIVGVGTGNAQAQAQAQPRPEESANKLVVHAVQIPREGKSPVIDGRVNEDVWLKVEPFADFVQQQPDDGKPATERSEVRVVYDRRAIYIGIICFDREPAKIIATQGHRDGDLTDTDAIRG